jgi:hypothetical protein
MLLPRSLDPVKALEKRRKRTQMLLMPRMLDPMVEAPDDDNEPRWTATVTVTPAQPLTSCVRPH